MLLLSIFNKQSNLLSIVRNHMKNMSTRVTLNLSQGIIEGEEISLPNGKSYCKFFGVPYAKPPIGKLRFKNPQPLEKFPEEPLNCTIERNVSLQINMFTKEIAGSEDCLYLNIHAPNIRNEIKYPVMVYIHGGGFMTGSGNRHILYPKFLIEENIILVTVNYRLGAFGFLSLPDGGISGNYGLKDQQLALKWIQDNIVAFNGDPNNITLFGQSAGGASAHYQLLSSQSRKYFHKLICHSGLATMEWAIAQNAQEKAFKLAEILGFKGNANETANFLRSFENTNEIITNMYRVLSKDERRHLLRLPFSPIVESENSSENPFITKDPLEIIKMENFSENIPVIMGYTSKEGIMLMSYSNKTADDIESDLPCLIPSTICDPESEQCKTIANNIRKFYFNGKQIQNEDMSQVCEVVGDICFVNDLHKTAKLHAEFQPKSPLYCFKFSYDGKLNFYKIRYKYEHVKGACHGDELYYLFYPNEAAEQIQPDEKDLEMIKKMCKLWTNFAKFGNPTPKTDENASNVIDFIWNQAVKTSDDNVALDILDISAKCSMEKNLDDERIQFWTDLLKENKREN